MIIDIGAIGLGGRNNGVFGINSAGQANGLAETTINDPNGEDFCGYGTHVKCLPFRWQNGVMTPLPLLGGNNGTVGNINQRGEIVGAAETGTQDKACPAPQLLDYQAVVWGPVSGQVRQLGPLPGDTVGLALWINDRGQAVGASGSCANTRLPPLALGPHAVLWESDGTPVNLGNLGGTGNPELGTGNMALGVNNAGEVVGASVLIGNTTTHAFLWARETGMRDLGTLPGDVNSAALAINDRGQVVGISYGAHGPFDGSGKPFLWQNGLMTDLTSLVPADSSLAVVFAGAINSRGEIAGFGATVHGDLHALVLTPTGASLSTEDVIPFKNSRPASRPTPFGRFRAQP
jgi:probable HAF family extracellular repeat protein